jgi:flagellar biosynthesis chaperone FliJ
MKVSTKLTSIKLLEDLYLQFKINTVRSKMSLQRLVNRSMYLYNIDNSFMKNIDSMNHLMNSGSGF